MNPQGDPSPELFDSLDDLQLRVARRADELAREGLLATELKLGCWLQAEQEILGVRLLQHALGRDTPDAANAGARRPSGSIPAGH